MNQFIKDMLPFNFCLDTTLMRQRIYTKFTSLIDISIIPTGQRNSDYNFAMRNEKELASFITKACNNYHPDKIDFAIYELNALIKICANEDMKGKLEHIRDSLLKDE